MEFSFDDLLNIKSDADFEKLALEIFRFQTKENSVYSDFVSQLNRKKPVNSQDIPFLPISFFKSHKISTKSQTEKIFFSSGTTSTRSKHYVADISLYEKNFTSIYEREIGKIEDQIILALLPNYIQQGDSSLVYMVNELIKLTQNNMSGFLLESPEEILQRYQNAISLNKKVVIFGVSYALLDLAEKNINLSQATIIETGGMKGRREELSKNELHRRLKKGLNVNSISSEYGMAELLSQAYSNEQGIFNMQPWFKVQTRDVNDPFSIGKPNKIGGLNVIDLANIYSCSFIATQDLGTVSENTFQLNGRFDHSDIRGCNLLLE